MQPAENKDYSRDVILRLSPTRNTIIVEEQKPGGIAAYREIDPLELYYVINQSYASNDYLDSGFLPEHCLHLSMSATEKYFVLWNPELRADVIYGDREYPNFPIPRMVFGVRVLENGKVAECSMGVVADEAPTVDKIPIVDTARRCGLVLDSRTLRRKEVEASCPFCGDHGPGKYHLSLNTDTDQYRCNLCGAHGNSVSLYARIKGICNKEAYLELAHESKVYPLPQPPSPQTQERQPCSLEQRHAVYSDMLAHLTLLPKHGENLLERGLSEERIRRNEYRSMPETERGRRLLADLLRSHGHDLHGIPGFRTYYGDWTLSGPNGFLIPVRNKDGLIQGLKIRLDDAQQANRKYRWLSSRNLPSGTRSYSWVHVTGNTQSKRAFLTEGPLKGDVASFLAQDALFICIGGVNALNGLNDTVRELGVREVVEAMDMDQMTNPNVRKAILTMRKEVRKIPGIRYSKYTWNPAYKGVDDYLLSQAATM